MATKQQGYVQRARAHLAKTFGRNQPKRAGVAMGGGSGGTTLTPAQVLFTEGGDPILTEAGQTILVG